MIERRGDTATRRRGDEDSPAISPRLRVSHSPRLGKRWVVREQNAERAARLARALNVSPIVAGLLIARGYDTVGSAHRFLNPSHDQLHDPLMMLGMKDAVARILRAIDAGEKILIYGDYDVDGTTGTVV